MIPRKGIVLLSRKNPRCPSCTSLKAKLTDMQRKGMIADFEIMDVVTDLHMPRIPVPQLHLNGNLILNGDSPSYTLEYIKKKLEV